MGFTYSNKIFNIQGKETCRDLKFNSEDNLDLTVEELDDPIRIVVRTNKPIAKGTNLFYYTGKYVPYDDENIQNTIGQYTMQLPLQGKLRNGKIQEIPSIQGKIGKKHIINAEEKRNIASLLHHAPRPGELSQYKFLDTDIEEEVACCNLKLAYTAIPIDLERGIVSDTYTRLPYLFAPQDIPANTLLSYSYGKKYWLNLNKAPLLLNRSGELIDTSKYQWEEQINFIVKSHNEWASIGIVSDDLRQVFLSKECHYLSDENSKKIFVFSQSDAITALSNFTNTVNSMPLNDFCEEAKCLVRLGIKFYAQGKFGQALENFQFAEKKFDSIPLNILKGLHAKQIIHERSSIYYNIGSVYHKQEKYQQAEMYLIKAYDFRKESSLPNDTDKITKKLNEIESIKKKVDTEPTVAYDCGMFGVTQRKRLTEDQSYGVCTNDKAASCFY